jgi:hypothetical protein
MPPEFGVYLLHAAQSGLRGDTLEQDAAFRLLEFKLLEFKDKNRRITAPNLAFLFIAHPTLGHFCCSSRSFHTI